MWRGSSCRCSTSAASWRCAPACRQASTYSPGTISTTRRRSLDQTVTTAMLCSEPSTPLRRLLRLRSWRSTPAIGSASRRSSSPHCRSRVTSSRRLPTSIRPGSSSSPTSTGIRTISGWWAGWRAGAPQCIWPSCSCWLIAPACCETRSPPSTGCGECCRSSEWSSLDLHRAGRLVTSNSSSLNLEPVLRELVDWRSTSFPAGPRVLLAPHGKTAMAPQLFQMQRDAGAWAVTAATTSQVRIWRAVGVDRVLLANELVEPAAIRWVAEEMRRDPAFDFHCLVDSVTGVRRLESGLAAAGLERPLRVLLELGFAGGRTGCRTPEQALQVARAVAGSTRLALAGVEVFEGVIHARGLAATLDAVDRFLGVMRSVVEDLDAAGLFDRVPEVIVSAGGSAFLDRVVAGLGASWKLSRPVRLVLRSGWYRAHDAIHYSELSPLGRPLPEY